MAAIAEELLGWLTTNPLVNQNTHYATLMDPRARNFGLVATLQVKPHLGDLDEADPR